MRGKGTDIGEIFRLIATDLGEQITAEVLPIVRRELDNFTSANAELCWSEEDTAIRHLGISQQKLAELAKNGQIGFSYSIKPTKWADDGKPQNGRRVYLRHHILNYLLHNEVKPATAGKLDMTPENVYQFRGKAA